MTAYWPKHLPVLTLEQEAIREDYYRHWLKIAPRQYPIFERINQWYAIARRPKTYCRTLEVGGGTGAHLAYEDLTFQEYTILELREELVDQIRLRHPKVRVVIGDVQKHIEAPDGSFDRVIAIHVLEHLPDLPSALREIRRIMHRDAYFSVVVPCEGGWAYELVRNITSRPLFQKRYGVSYDWCIESEHVNNIWEILDELQRHFTVVEKSYWPLGMPLINLNLVIGLTCTQVCPGDNL